MDYYGHVDPYANVDPYAPPMKKQKGNKDKSSDKVVTLQEKVEIPKDKYPGYNFVGSIIGPQGSILKALQETTKSKLSILGKGSMRDKKKEAELAKSDEDEHKHLKEPMHVLIEVKAPRVLAHRRMADALVEVYKFMVPPPAEGPMAQQFGEGPYNAYGEAGYPGDGYGGEGYGVPAYGGEGYAAAGYGGAGYSGAAYAGDVYAGDGYAGGYGGQFGGQDMRGPPRGRGGLKRARGGPKRGAGPGRGGAAGRSRGAPRGHYTSFY